MTIAERLGEFLAFIFQPVAPLLSLAFVLTLLLRNLRAYWPVALYFFIVSLQGTLSYFYKINQIPLAYIAFTAADLGLLGVIAWQLGRNSFISYPSLAAFTAKALRILLPVCVVLAVITIFTDPVQTQDRHPGLQLTLAIERSIRTAILVFLLVIGAFAGWFPVRMKQNSARLLIGFLVLQAYECIALLAANTRWQWTAWGNFWGIFVTAEVLLYWLIALKPDGELAVASTVPRWDPQQMTSLTTQLEEMQSALARRGY